MVFPDSNNDVLKNTRIILFWKSNVVDYNCFNYCSTCELKYPKEILHCKYCRQKIRVKPWHRSKILDSKRI